MIRLASLGDIDRIKQVAQRYVKEIGFILRPALEEAVRREELLYDPSSGAFCHFHRRRDGVTTLYEICVPDEARGRGLARQMIDMLLVPIQLKCPVDNVSNGFYEHLGFELVEVVQGKKRDLNVWRLNHR